MGINWSSAWADGQKKTATTPPAAPPTVAPIVAAEAKPTASSAPKSSAAPSAAKAPSSSSGGASLWKGIKGLANEITSFGTATSGGGAVVDAIGNIGGPQGSNMMLVDAVGSNAFTITFINTSPSSMTVAVWNKAFSRDGTVANAEANLGSCVAPVTPILSIALASQGQQVVAFQDGTLLGWSEAVDQTIVSGAFATTWGEGKLTSGGSGYDVSAIVNPGGNNYDMAISSKESPCVSDQTQNYWEAANGNPDTPVAIGTSDGSCYIPGSVAHLTVKMGGAN
jgi:hypothetical protein